MTEAVQANIAEGLREFAVAADSIRTHPRNYNQGDVDAIAESLARFGQVRPVVVQKSTQYIVAGNHTYRAAVEKLGWPEVARVEIEIDDDEALAYLVADNRTAELATKDDKALAGLLESMMLSGKLAGTGYTPDDVDDLLSAMDAMPETEPEGFQGGHSVSREELEARFKDRSQVALRQFVLMYEQSVAEEVEALIKALGRKWGVSGAREVFLESIRRAAQDPDPVHVAALEWANATTDAAVKEAKVKLATAVSEWYPPVVEGEPEGAEPEAPAEAPAEVEA